MGKPLGIIAGGGDLPIVLAEAAARTQPIFIVRLSGYADAALAVHPGIDRNIGTIGGTIEALRAAGCAHLVFVGSVARPDLSTVELDEVGQSHVPTLLEAARQGDDALLASLVQIFASQGFEVLGAHEIYSDLLCPVGLVAGTKPDELNLSDLDKAYRMARLIGREDIGQGCVVADGLVLALEAQEGTDGMLRRLADLPQAVRGTTANRRGVLVKCAKPGQDRRIDLPVIGVQTVRNVAEAGLAGIGLEAGSCLIVDREGVTEETENSGIFVVGLEHVPSTDTA